MGQDLSTLSIVELDERIELLEREIERLRGGPRPARRRREDAASAFFKIVTLRLVPGIPDRHVRSNGRPRLLTVF